MLTNKVLINLLKIKAITLFLGLCITFQVFSSPGALNTPEESAFQLGLSLGYGIQEDAFITDEDENFYYMLDISYYGDYFFLDNTDLGLYLYTGNNFTANLVVNYSDNRNIFQPISHLTRGLSIARNSNRGETTSVTSADEPSQEYQNPNEVDSDGVIIVEDKEIVLPEREGSIQAGLEFLYENELGIFHSQWSKDVSSTHDGQSFFMSYSNQHQLLSATLSYSIGVNYFDRSFVSYYYGVESDEANDLFSAYSPKNSINSFVKLGFSKPIQENLSAYTFFVYEKFGSSIKQSPLINQNSTSSAFIGFYYRFF
jgi:outer membrane protein